LVEQKQPDIPLTEKDKKKEVVIQGVIAGKITQKTAATMLELSTRQIRRLEERYEAGGAAALVHQGRGKLSNHQGSVEDVGRVLELLHGKYKDMGPTLAAEQLEERDGIKISRETIRRLLIKEGLWEASSQLNEKHRRWRQRSPCFGSLVQMDTSFHNWFGNDHPKSYLIG
jgi:transposase